MKRKIFLTAIGIASLNSSVLLFSCNSTNQVTPQSSFEWEIESEPNGQIGRIKLKKFIGNEVNIIIPKYVYEDEATYKVVEIMEYAFSNNKQIKSVVCPDSVESIDGYSFQDCTNLKSAVIYGDLCGSYAFSFCTNLTRIEMHNCNTLKIGTFSYANKIEYVKFGNETWVMHKIMHLSWDHPYPSLKEIFISNSVILIGDEALNYFNNLNTIKYDGTVEQWKSISKPQGWHASVPTNKVYCIKSKMYCDLDEQW